MKRTSPVVGASHTSVIKSSFSPIVVPPTNSVQIFSSVSYEDEYIDPVGDVVDDDEIRHSLPKHHLVEPPPSISVIKPSPTLLQNQFSSRDEHNRMRKRYTGSSVYNNQRSQPYKKHHLDPSLYSDVIQSCDFVPSTTHAHSNNRFSTSLIKPKRSIVDYEIYRKHLSEIYLSRSSQQYHSRLYSTMEQQDDPYLVNRYRDYLLHEHPHPLLLQTQRYTGPRGVIQDQTFRRSEEKSFNEQKHLRQFYDQRKRKSMFDLKHPVYTGVKERYEQVYERPVATTMGSIQY